MGYHGVLHSIPEETEDYGAPEIWGICQNRRLQGRNFFYIYPLRIPVIFLGQARSPVFAASIAQ